MTPPLVVNVDPLDILNPYSKHGNGFDDRCMRVPTRDDADTRRIAKALLVDIPSLILEYAISGRCQSAKNRTRCTTDETRHRVGRQPEERSEPSFAHFLELRADRGHLEKRGILIPKIGQPSRSKRSRNRTSVDKAEISSPRRCHRRRRPEGMESPNDLQTISGRHRKTFGKTVKSAYCRFGMICRPEKCAVCILEGALFRGLENLFPQELTKHPILKSAHLYPRTPRNSSPQRRYLVPVRSPADASSRFISHAAVKSHRWQAYASGLSERRSPTWHSRSSLSASAQSWQAA